VGPALIEDLRAAHLRLLQRGPASDAMIRHGLSGHVMPQVLAELEGCDPFAWLEGFRGPVLLLNGSLDPAFRQDESALRALLPQARLQVLPGAGHLTNLDRPREFSEAVRGFVRDLRG
jgi:pimeloyl-ACP methyl ester carboxylesterase